MLSPAVMTARQDRTEKALSLIARLEKRGITKYKIAQLTKIAYQTMWNWTKGSAPQQRHVKALEKLYNQEAGLGSRKKK